MNCFLIIFFLSLSSLQYEAFGVRKLKDQKVEEEEDMEEKKRSDHLPNNSQGFFATSNRVVPSCPDPLHNR